MGCAAVKVAQPQSKLPSCVDSQIIKLFDNEANRTLEIKQDKKLIAKILEAKKKATLYGDATDLEELKKAEAEREKNANNQILERLWAKFDMDKNNSLDEEEIGKLLNVYLQTAVYWLKKTIVTASIRRLEAELAVDGNEISDGQTSHVTAALEKHAGVVLQKWVKEKGNPDVVSKIFKAMDKNSDGIVDHGEFLAAFMDALKQDVCCSLRSRTLAKKVAKASRQDIAWIFKSNAV